MKKFKFDIQIFADVIHGNSSQNQLKNTADNAQIYGLAGNDTLESVNKKNVTMIGGSGNDVLNMSGGTGTLSGGDGADIFNLNYSASNPLSAVIEDIDPSKDKISINYNGNDGTPKINYTTSGKDIVLTDDKGYLNVTLKGYREANDYFEGDANENIWAILKIVNQERENQGLKQLTLSQGLMDGSSIRAVEIEESFSHTRPNNTTCFTAVKKSYNSMGENIAAGYDSPNSVMVGWMNSSGHRANILNKSFNKIGIGYYYQSGSYYGNHWVQMFGGELTEYETLTEKEMLSTKINLSVNNSTVKDSTLEKIANVEVKNKYGTSADDMIVNGTWYGEIGEKNIKITGGKGNDTITSSGSNSLLDGEEDNDLIYNGYYYYSPDNFYENSYNNEYNDENGSSKVTINGGAGNDTVQNKGKEALINGGADNDSIKNSGDKAIINGDSGNDFIVNGEWWGTKGGKNVTINGGDGKDTITSSGSNSLLDGGSGDDLIYNGYYNYYGSGTFYENSYNNEYNDENGSSKVTVNGGAGNDEIHNLGKSFTYNYTSGNDTIFGFNSTDTLKICDSSYTTARSGNDLKVNVGDGSILVKDAANLTLNIVTLSSGGTDTTPADTLPAGISISNSILTAASTFKGNKIDLADYKDATKVNAAALSQAVSIIGSAAANSLKGGKGADTISGGKGNDTVSLGAGADVYIYSGGNDYIQDYTAGADKIKLASGSISGASVSGSDVILKVGTGSIKVKSGKGKNITVIDGNGKETTTIYGGSGTDTLPAGISISNSILTAASTFKGNKIDLADYPTATKVNAAAVSQAVSIIGSAAANSLKGGKGADTISGGKGNDTVSLGGGNDVYIYSGGNDYIQDYTAGKDKIKLASGSISSASISGSDVILKVGTGSIKVKGSKEKNITVIDGNGKETTTIYGGSGTDTLPAGISISNSILTAASTFKGNKIDLADYPTATKVNAASLSQAVSIIGSAAANSLKGGKGADTISGGKGNDTVSLGGGNDVYIYSGGNDLIQDYTAGKDKIKLSSGSISSASVSGNDVILKVGTGSIKVKSGKGKNITVIDSNGKETTTIYPSVTPDPTLTSGWKYGNTEKTKLVATLSSAANIDLTKTYGTSVVTVDGAKVTKNISITGNTKANSIKGGSGNDTISGGAGKDTLYGGSGNDKIYGGNDNDKLYGDAGNDKILGDAGNDSLYGGTGNDTLTGGDGKDVFIYEGGKDVITDYTAGQDKIKISSGKITKTTYSSNDVIFTIGSGTLTVKGMKGKNISVTDSSGKTQTYSKTFDLLNDSNFVTDEFGIDEISEQKFEVTQIQTADTSKEFKAENLITYSEDK